MPATTAEITQLRRGAKEAHNVNIHRLGHLLSAIADVAQELHDGIDPVSIAVSLDGLIEHGAKVARDLCRNVTTTDEATA